MNFMELSPIAYLISSIKIYALTVGSNGEEEEEISCFKPWRPCADGYNVLKEQLMIFSAQENTHNPFEIPESDVEDAQFSDNITSDDKEDNVDFDWKTNQNHILLILLLSFVFKKKTQWRDTFLLFSTYC